MALHDSEEYEESGFKRFTAVVSLFAVIAIVATAMFAVALYIYSFVRKYLRSIHIKEEQENFEIQLKRDEEYIRKYAADTGISLAESTKLYYEQVNEVQRRSASAVRTNTHHKQGAGFNSGFLASSVVSSVTSAIKAINKKS